MTQDEIIEMARQARLMSEYDEASPWVEDHEITEYVTAFAKLVAAKEREIILQSTIQAHEVGGFTDVVACSAIRARGEA
jgi:hypothetical protein